MNEEVATPRERVVQFGREDVERGLRTAIRNGTFTHGWILAGPEGSGKATLAYRLARALLDPDALSNPENLQMSADARTHRLIAGDAHPDMFVAERLWDEKKGKQQSEITVETIRKLTAFLNRTASGGGARVAIVDTADDMNRNAANALLKALEEPPPGATLLLLSSAPGRLLPTIRSRCRRLDLQPLSDEVVEKLLISEGVAAKRARQIAIYAKGLPGYALTLAAGEGEEAIALARQFLPLARSGGDLSRIVSAVTGKAGDARWPVFRDSIQALLSDAARASAVERPIEGLEGASAGALLDAWEAVTRLTLRGEALNLDRAQLIEAIAYDVRNALAGRVA